MTTSAQDTTISIRALRAAVDGEVITPEDPGYDRARTIFYGGFDRHPAVIVRVANDTDVSHVVSLARDTGTELAIRALGGAAARVPNDATAYAHRDRRLMVGIAAMFENLEDKDIYESWVDELASEIRGDDPTAYVNFIGEEGPDRIRHAYPGTTWDRLTAIKAKYDPSNLFRLNQNIPPGRE